MTIDVHITDIVTAIAGLTMTGITNVNINAIPATVRDSLPLFCPNVSEPGFISDLTFARKSFGSDSTAKMDLEYNLNYRYFHAVVGKNGEALLATYDEMITNLVAILEVILANSTPNGSVDVTLNATPRVGAVSDAAGVLSYHGADIQLHVVEFAQ